MTALDQRTNRLGAVNHVTGLDRLACLGECPEGLRIGPDLSGLAQSEVRLDGSYDGLLHAAVVLLGSGAKLGVEIGGKAKGHSHTVTIPIRTR